VSAGFTPGPWQWVNDDDIEQAEHPFASVAEVVRIFQDEDRSQRNANARLIAAAPELYAKLEGLLEYVRLFCADSSPTDAAVADAVAALAKARGES
jgi:hypothetical protein